ncbi:unnamed protein product [Amoebophrya sp. A25]|nr:unnamed protein product [Amoebophrya sp. A25]|eukprot:GSA25T00005777001.1
MIGALGNGDSARRSSSDVLQGIANSLHDMAPPVSLAELPFFAILFAVGVFLSFFGHKLKKTVLFVAGALLPVFLLTVDFEATKEVKIILVGVLGVCAGIFFVKFPKCGLGGIGAVWGAAMGRMLFFFLGNVLKEDVFTPNREVINAVSIIVCSILGGALLAGCFSKMYCVVIPFVGGVLGADSLAHVVILGVHKWVREWRPFFPLDTPLLITVEGITSDRNQVRHYVDNMARTAERAVDEIFTNFASVLGGEMPPESSDLRHLLRYRFPWGIWIVFFLLCFIVGVKLQIDEYQREKKENKKLQELSDDERLVAHSHPPGYRRPNRIERGRYLV